MAKGASFVNRLIPNLFILSMRLDLLNVPMAPAYNFVLGAGKQYSHEDSIPIWDVLETIIGGLAAGESIAFLS